MSVDITRRRGFSPHSYERQLIRAYPNMDHREDDDYLDHLSENHAISTDETAGSRKVDPNWDLLSKENDSFGGEPVIRVANYEKTYNQIRVRKPPGAQGGPTVTSVRERVRWPEKAPAPSY